MAFDDSGVPRLRESSSDSVEVTLQMTGESLEAGQVGGGCRFDPCRQSVALQLGEHVGEGAHVPGEFVQFGTGGRHGLELDPVALEQSAGAREDPAGDGAGGRLPGTDPPGLAA
ncbi:hypothetical protein [Streptomyces sp. NPDC090445]|uniref:hypothetical protein n=1 Tax=Streptomyces sp. NPDC090445 TaxID=3365963 RepID=UPI0038249969